MTPVAPTVWRAAADAHVRRTLGLVGGSTAHDRSHPVYNFIFQYYSFDPKVLARWTPGPGVVLGGTAPRETVLWQGRGWRQRGSEGFVDPGLAKESVRLRKVAEVLRATAARAPHFNCYGLHEWAMLYRPAGAPEPQRHQALPLRLSQAELNAVVEAQRPACTHFDAYRFFTPAARPLNAVKPEPRRATQANFEQPGCLHVTMDLFRYALKLWPYLPAELLTDALELAIHSRALDMRASPYDLSSWHGHRGTDLSPVPIETADGRRAYQRGQADLAALAAPVRARLLDRYDAMIACWDGDGADATCDVAGEERISESI